MEAMYIDALKFTDYVMANYVKGAENGVNMYIAYYESQRKGESVHSPKGCLPGGGWVIKEFDQKVVDGVTVTPADAEATVDDGFGGRNGLIWVASEGP